MVWCSTRGVMLAVVAALLLILTCFAFASHFVPQFACRSETSSTSETELASSNESQFLYTKLFFSHMANGVTSEGYTTETRFSYHFPLRESVMDDSLRALRSICRLMIAANVLALMGTICGGVATLLVLQSLVAPLIVGLDVARLVLTASAAVFCLIATALVAACSSDEGFKAVREAMMVLGYGKCKLYAGFAFICVAFAGYTIVFALDLIAFVCLRRCCRCTCDGADSRDAWSGTADGGHMRRQDSKFSYGGPIL